MAYSILFPSLTSEAMEDIEYYPVLPDYIDAWSVGDDDTDSDGDPLTKEIHFYEEEIDIDDQYELIQHDYQNNSSVNGVQRLVSMKKSTTNLQPAIASSSRAESSTTRNDKKPVRQPKTTRKPRGRPRKNPPKEVEYKRGPYKVYTDQAIIEFLDKVQNETFNVFAAAKKIAYPKDYGIHVLGALYDRSAISAKSAQKEEAS
ncbi:hypothetical protein BJV82DRAFT_581763 [Fennellomyces sp. T-0311]|nr:hypothetical protein BJV82DRAFT_581763 [Fennellomyces sp. T-0311]